MDALPSPPPPLDATTDTSHAVEMDASAPPPAPINTEDDVAAPPTSAPRAQITYSWVDDFLVAYKQLFKITMVVEPPNAYTFHEQFRCLLVEVALFPGIDLQILREALELYTLLLFLHRNTTSDALFQDRRLRLDTCARDSVAPEIRLQIDWAKFSDTGERVSDVDAATEYGHALWKDLLDLFEYDTPQPQPSDHYATTRRMILELYNVDEAFVATAAARVTLCWKWCSSLAGMMELMPVATLRRLELIVPESAMPAENASRSRLLFGEVTSRMESTDPDYEVVARHTKEWLLASKTVESLTVTISSGWTADDALDFVALLDKGHVHELQLKVATVREFALAMDICAQVETVTDAVLVLKILEMNAGDAPVCGLTHMIRRGSGLRSLRIQMTKMPTMVAFVDTMLLLLDGECPSTRTAIEDAGELQLATCVYDPSVQDLPELVRLLDKVGTHIKLLQVDSYGSSEFFNDDTFTNAPEAFRLEPILAACPNLRVLNMQGAIFEDLPSLYSKGLAAMQTLQVQWAPEKSILTLADALGNPDTPIARQLQEFSTRAASDAVLEGFTEALKHNQRMRYLRVGRRPLGDELASALNAHQQKMLASGGTAFAALLDEMAAAGSQRAAFARDCMDDDVLEAIADFVGPTLYRQIHMR